MLLVLLLLLVLLVLLMLLLLLLLLPCGLSARVPDDLLSCIPVLAPDFILPAVVSLVHCTNLVKFRRFVSFLLVHDTTQLYFGEDDCGNTASCIQGLLPAVLGDSFVIALSISEVSYRSPFFFFS